MSSQRFRSLLRTRRRAVNQLLEPRLQLRLPLFLVAMTLGFTALWMGVGLLAFERLFEGALATTSDRGSLVLLLEDQTRGFLIWTALLGTAHALAVFALCVTVLHKVLGPAVAFRRQLEALKNGDYAQRVRLRKGDALSDVADSLNELADILERSQKPVART